MIADVAQVAWDLRPGLTGRAVAARASPPRCRTRRSRFSGAGQRRDAPDEGLRFPCRSEREGRTVARVAGESRHAPGRGGDRPGRPQGAAGVPAAAPEAVAEGRRLKEAALLDFGVTEQRGGLLAVHQVPPPDPDHGGGHGGRGGLRATAPACCCTTRSSSSRSGRTGCVRPVPRGAASRSTGICTWSEELRADPVFDAGRRGLHQPCGADPAGAARSCPRGPDGGGPAGAGGRRSARGPPACTSPICARRASSRWRTRSSSRPTCGVRRAEADARPSRAADRVRAHVPGVRRAAG